MVKSHMAYGQVEKKVKYTSKVSDWSLTPRQYFSAISWQLIVTF